MTDIFTKNSMPLIIVESFLFDGLLHTTDTLTKVVCCAQINHSLNRHLHSIWTSILVLESYEYRKAKSDWEIKKKWSKNQLFVDMIIIIQ